MDHRQEMLRVQNADRGAMTDLVFRVLIDCLRLNQSVEVYGHIFRTLHVFLPLFNKLVFRARNSFIADLLPGLDGLGGTGGGSHAKNEYTDLDTLTRQTKRAAVLIYRLTH